MSGGYHLFALVPAGTALPTERPAGLENGPIQLLPVGSLAAVGQQVSAEFLARLQEGGGDPVAQAWLTDRLLDHERVVEAFATAGPTLPLGFGVVLADPFVLRAALAPHQETLAGFFAGAVGRQEWCLKFFLRDEAPKRGEMAMTARSGLDYLAARRALPAQRAAREAAGHAFVDGALGGVEPLCEAVLAREAGAAPAKGLRLLANLALLLREENQAALLQAVEALVAPAAAEGLELTLTGPWPLYSFRPRIAFGAAI